jgi:hypothetical protein
VPELLPVSAVPEMLLVSVVPELLPEMDWEFASESAVSELLPVLAVSDVRTALASTCLIRYRAARSAVDVAITITNTIDNILKDDKLKKMLLKKGLERAQMFSWDIGAMQLMNVIHDIGNGKL